MAVYHIAYGLGFLTGILKLMRRPFHGAAPDPLFTALTSEEQPASFRVVNYGTADPPRAVPGPTKRNGGGDETG